MKQQRPKSKGKHSPADHDPLTQALQPPPDETEPQRLLRLQHEAAAAARSAQIDSELDRQRTAEKKRGKPVKLLLLGASTSFQSLRVFRADRAAWRAVIQLNIVRSVRFVLDTLSAPSSSPQLTPHQRHLCSRLSSPLQHVETLLVRKLSVDASLSEPALLGAAATSVGRPDGRLVPLQSKHPRDICVNVNARSGWHGAFVPSTHDHHHDHDTDPDGPAAVLHACAEDMSRLYRDPVIRSVLREKQVQLEDMGGFFLDCVERVTAPDYIPTDDDILRARIKTLGVSEYRFTLGTNGSVGRDWRVYDVGGHRSLVAAWVPFFDDMNAIIFLAPMSAFDQVLEEDHSVNRIEDSVLLWKSIVTNPLLAHTNLVLFLNKSDILRAKLAAGIRFADYVVSYGGRPNDFESVSKYLRRKFHTLHKENSPETRPFYCHTTCVTDTKSTFVILENVQDTVIRDNLKRSYLMD
ncbi:G-alpha-domain-containing protein [Punctularia strigosozonata HHB-11173 SS5]|uniref:G-alpha-domain-containing protein n=1 Tax=Punctularia strigosozonata (strain HHB-11173) TaxID=741275 RepID=UPI000441737A|nr:G-alpha-domain-containing protein [Punctularia strigosozonata HHB-11173 SS5]EIN08840.1 G-alpha-domain-containing protein [Punctularia strigosozonata HHB-11173 SS5]